MMNKIGLNAIDYDSAFRQSLSPISDDFDALGHVNNIVYLRWVQDIATAHWWQVTSQNLRDRLIFVVLRHEIDYRDPVLPGEAVEVSTWLGQSHGPRFQRHVDIRKKGARKFSAKALTTWCMVDRVRGRPQRVTDEIFEAFGVDPAVLK